MEGDYKVYGFSFNPTSSCIEDEKAGILQVIASDFRRVGEVLRK